MPEVLGLNQGRGTGSLDRDIFMVFLSPSTKMSGVYLYHTTTQFQKYSYFSSSSVILSSDVTQSRYLQRHDITKLESHYGVQTGYGSSEIFLEGLRRTTKCIMIIGVLTPIGKCYLLNKTQMRYF